MCLSPVCFADDTQTGQSHSRAAHTDGSVCVGASLGWFPVWAVCLFFRLDVCMHTGLDVPSVWM